MVLSSSFKKKKKFHKILSIRYSYSLTVLVFLKKIKRVRKTRKGKKIVGYMNCTVFLNEKKKKLAKNQGSITS